MWVEPKWERDYSATSIFDGSPSVVLLAYQLPGSNAWNTAKSIKAKMAELSQNFPPGLKVAVEQHFVRGSFPREVSFKTQWRRSVHLVIVFFRFRMHHDHSRHCHSRFPSWSNGVCLRVGATLNQLTIFASSWQRVWWWMMDRSRDRCQTLKE